MQGNFPLGIVQCLALFVVYLSANICLLAVLSEQEIIQLSARWPGQLLNMCGPFCRFPKLWSTRVLSFQLSSPEAKYPSSSPLTSTSGRGTQAVSSIPCSNKIPPTIPASSRKCASATWTTFILPRTCALATGPCLSCWAGTIRLLLRSRESRGLRLSRGFNSNHPTLDLGRSWRRRSSFFVWQQSL